MHSIAQKLLFVNNFLNKTIIFSENPYWKFDFYLEREKQTVHTVLFISVSVNDAEMVFLEF